MSTRTPSAARQRASRDALERLATRAGFSVRWEDAHGREQHVPQDTLAALLTALGLPCGTRDEAAQSQAALDAELAASVLPPLVTAECHRAISLPRPAAKPNSRYRIELEGGGAIEGHVSAPGGEPAIIAPVAEPGYHTLLVDGAQVRLAVAPRRCHTVDDARRAGAEKATAATATDRARQTALWGIGAQLYSLRRDGDGGLGDYTALATFAEESARRGAAALAVSPTHAMFSADPSKFSPYSPSSRLFLNVAHIDPAAVLGAQAAGRALEAAGVRDAWAALESAPLIDWPRALSLRLAVLRSLFESFCAHEHASGSALAADFSAFCARGGRALEDHARFEALDAYEREHNGRMHWREWAAGLTDPRGKEVRAFAEAHRREVEFHLFMQWLAAKGLDRAQQSAREAGMAIGLVADLAVGCDGAGSHAWSYCDDMLQKVSVGAPPDLFNQAGQAWGLTTFSPRAMRNQGFTAFIDMLRASFAHAGGLRIDHVLGLQRLWLVPEGAQAKDGAYLNYPFADLLRLIALESSRHRAVVIGEDLGTVPPGFRERLAQHGLLGMRVLWFEREPDGHGFLPPQQWGDHSLATTTTHDLPTVAGWWQGHDIDWRHRIGQTVPRRDGRDPVAAARDERAADRDALWEAFQRAGLAPDDTSAPPPDQPPVDEALAYVSSTPTPLAVYPLEDLLGTIEQPNLPGSIDEHPNWRRRLTAPLDMLFADAGFNDRLLALARLRDDMAQRVPKPDERSAP
ncbi:4-alpha-glucanotransferase [Trinickia caryophylli]|uniref:4-alpha-glucanotransferase n=1 Tax=Trinickia caryophylli TaxID=28094 RepID=A0A1X7EGH1_TRICW|nr:4-alpha-glucanotransferase [Trinickia caryophylli]PMS11057.1 4-alpha-glucanotransferase [Trinickia caryophylli]TRX14513.1 4-alpha-glucanotransferase [Trinickia caryophylli]WQE14353.1 4-alpha-glucanotransferase [Trinickia caryophylli]SMF33611.1 4-alpha-glucanotransferase [Trinickia caryophylli]GLU32260.1 4-alpha-glucanotransferase [Trinickia caryophylli]